MKNSRWMRFLLITLSVVMVLSLFACGGNGGEEETTVDNTEETTVGGGDETTVGGDDETTVGGDDETTVGGGDETTVGGDDETTVGGGEETTVPEPVFEGNWHVSVDAFLADVDGDFGAIEVNIGAAATNKTNGTTIINAEGAHPSVVANFVCFSAGWIAVDGYDVTSWTAKIYAADGTLLNTVAHQLHDAEEGVVNHVSQNMGFAAGTVAHRLGLETTILTLGEYAGQTVTVVYEAAIAGTEFTVEMVKIDVEVPEVPGEETTEPIEINVELTPDKLAGITNVTSVGSITLSEDGSYVTVKPAEGANDIYFYAYHGNTAVTGRYAIIKYRTSANVTHFNIYASTSRDGATDGDDLTTAYIVADGEWHVMLVDLSLAKTVEADENGEYTVKFLRIDPFRGVGNATGNEEVEIAYVGVHDSIADLDLVANSSAVLELGNQFTFSIDSADLGGIAFSGGLNGEGVRTGITVSRDNANIAISGGWLVVQDTSFANMGLYYKIVDANGNATRLTNAGMNIKAAEQGVWDACAGGFPGATPMRIDTANGGLVFPDLKAYSGQTVTIYLYAISDSIWEEQGVIAGRVVLALTVTVERSFKVSVNGVDYEDVVEAFAAAQNGDTIKLGKDVTVPTALVIDKEITVDLNGHTISAPEDTVGDGVFHVVEGGVLTINGNGTVNGVCQSEYDMAIWADGGKVIINGGTYTNVGAGEDTQYDLIYVKNGGEIVINGGTFICATPKWTLNSHDTLKGTITVNGGTFYKYDPSNMATENGITSWVADGLYGKADGDNYVVVPYYNDLDVAFSGDALKEQIVNGYGDCQSKYEAVANGDGTVTLKRTDASGEAYFTALINDPNAASKKTTGQYLVIKYRTTAANAIRSNVFASTNVYAAENDKQAYYAIQLCNDGAWHVLVVDLDRISDVAATDGVYNINFVRVDFGSTLGLNETIDFGYVGVCDTLTDIVATDTIFGGYEMFDNYRGSHDGGTAALGSANENEALVHNVELTSFGVWGWCGVKFAATDIAYAVVADGQVSEWTNDCAWAAETGVVNAVTSALGSSATPLRINIGKPGETRGHTSQIDLSAYAGQTVTVYVAARQVVDGQVERVQILYVAHVTVPKA